MTPRMRTLRRDLGVNMRPDMRDNGALFWWPLSVEGRISLQINLLRLQHTRRYSRIRDKGQLDLFINWLAEHPLPYNQEDPQENTISA
jgi:hypothetical protein